MQEGRIKMSSLELLNLVQSCMCEERGRSMGTEVAQKWTIQLAGTEAITVTISTNLTMFSLLRIRICQSL